MKNKFYFTFGNHEQFPYRFGYVLVLADNREKAMEIFSNKYPIQDGTVNCSFIYDEKEFAEAVTSIKSRYTVVNQSEKIMKQFNYCHETLAESKRGICPCCGCEELGYGAIQLDGDSCYFPWECDNCRTTGKESYNLEFVGQENINV